MNVVDRINKLADKTLLHCESWIKKGADGQFYFEDPIDKKEIAAHYGTTHFSVALIVMGINRDNYAQVDKGVKLLSDYLSRWEKSIMLPSFHFDFNNFALCIASDYLAEYRPDFCEKIKEIVLSTQDSSHDTINWLPMRWYVNLKRHKWTGNKKYLDACHTLSGKIDQATNKDGGIEDILPKGKSFNLQYDVATTGTLQFLRIRGVEYDLCREVGFLVNAVAPDGDINYQGRGTNQIFAWSLWIYLLSSAGKIDALKKALDFIEDKLPVMLVNNNIFLNNDIGKNKYLWWDYHYSSVYTAHFLFWLSLATADYLKLPINEKIPVSSDTGLKIYKNEYYFVASFEGRKEYLSERGPSINSIWIKNGGMVFKGNFGPWQGLFGNNYSFGTPVLRNYCGLIENKENKNWGKNKFVRRFLPSFISKTSSEISPLFAQFSVLEQEEFLELTWYNNLRRSAFINIPVLLGAKCEITAEADTLRIPLYNVISIRNQYGEAHVLQSKPSNSKVWKLIIRIKK